MAVSLPKGWFDEVRRRAAVDAVEADHLLRAPGIRSLLLAWMPWPLNSPPSSSMPTDEH